MKRVWKSFRSPSTWVETALWSVDWLWRIIRPTLITALCVNSRVHNISSDEADSYEDAFRKELDNCTPEELSFALNTLVSLQGSDHLRIRGIETKAFGTLPVAGLVMAGNAFTLNLVLDRQTQSATWATIAIVASAIYLLASLVAELYVRTLRDSYELTSDDVLSSKDAGARLARYMKLNQHASTKLSNLTDAAIYDVRRALVTAAIALTIAVIMVAPLSSC